MVERVARGSILMPAVAAIGAATAAMVAPTAAVASSSKSTLQMRVQVVESCQIRLSAGGLVDDSCRSGSIAISPPTLPRVQFSLSPTFPARAIDVPRLDWMASEPGVNEQSSFALQTEFDATNSRAQAKAAQIAERVRYVTFSF